MSKLKIRITLKYNGILYNKLVKRINIRVSYLHSCCSIFKVRCRSSRCVELLHYIMLSIVCQELFSTVSGFYFLAARWQLDYYITPSQLCQPLFWSIFVLCHPVAFPRCLPVVPRRTALLYYHTPHPFVNSFFSFFSFFLQKSSFQPYIPHIKGI